MLEIQPDLVVSDVMMPGMGGASLLTAMRDNAYLEEVPVIVMSGMPEESDRQGLPPLFRVYLPSLSICPPSWIWWTVCWEAPIKPIMAHSPGAHAMYVPPAFREEDLSAIHHAMREARLVQLVTAGPDGLMATPLPMLLAADEGRHGVLYGHMARANPHWRAAITGEALAIFMGPMPMSRPPGMPASRATARSCRPGTTWRCMRMVRWSSSTMRSVCCRWCPA